MKLKRTVKYYYYKFIRLQGNPLYLAGGASIGVFVGLTPTIPFHTLLILCLTFMTRTSAIAGIIISWIVFNPLTLVPIYFMSVVLGNIVTPFDVSWERVEVIIDSLLVNPSFFDSVQLIFNLGFETAVVLVSGGILFALPFSLLSYFFLYRFFTKILKKRAEKFTKKIYG